MAAEKNQLVLRLENKIAGWIRDGLVFADDVDDHGARFRLQVDVADAFADRRVAGGDVAGLDGALCQDLADLVEGLLGVAHFAQNAVGFVPNDVALRQHDAVGNVKHLEDAAEDLNGGLEFLGDDVVGAERQQFLDVRKVFCPDDHVQLRIEAFGVGQAVFREKTVGNGDDHDACLLHAGAPQNFHVGCVSPDRVCIPAVFRFFDFLKIQIDHCVADGGIFQHSGQVSAVEPHPADNHVIEQGNALTLKRAG